MCQRHCIRGREVDREIGLDDVREIHVYGKTCRDILQECDWERRVGKADHDWTQKRSELAYSAVCTGADGPASFIQDDQRRVRERDAQARVIPDRDLCRTQKCRLRLQLS